MFFFSTFSSLLLSCDIGSKIFPCKETLIVHVKEDYVEILACADPEVRYSNTKESVLYFISSKNNLF